MPTITVQDETYRRLSERAAALNTTIEEVVNRLARQETPNDPRALSMDEWKAKFHAIVELARSRADRYPPGFEADISRESMYPDDSGPLACPTQSVVTERSM